MLAQRLAVPLFVLLVVVTGCSDPDTDRIDVALRENVSPSPGASEILAACNAMDGADWDFQALFNERGRTRLVEIVAVIENTRWDNVSRKKTDASWDAYYTSQDFQFYCMEKRREG